MLKTTNLRARFWLTQNIRNIWNKRSATSHQSESIVLVNKGKDHGIYMILDLDISRKILISSCFSTINHFNQACEYLEFAGTPAITTCNHFNSSVLYLEGKSHVEKKRTVSKILAELENDLERLKPSLVSHFSKNSLRYKDSVTFAESFIGITIGCLISKLVGISIVRVMRSIRVRKPFFYGYFNPKGVLRADAALK